MGEKMSVWRTFQVEEEPCPNCGVVMNALGYDFPDEENTREPKDGDVVVCVQCHHVMAMNEDGTTRELNEDEEHKRDQAEENIRNCPDTVELWRKMTGAQPTGWKRVH